MTNNWIFLRGLGRDSRHWGIFTELFKSHFPTARVYCLDLPGSGRFAHQTCPKDMALIAEHLEQQWRSVQPEQPANILALSMGGMAALQWQQQYPESIESLVLMNISSRLSPFYERLNYRAYKALLSLFLASAEKKEQMIIHLTSNLYPYRSQLLKQWTAFALDNPVRGKNLFRQLVAASGFNISDDKPERPVLILNSLQDRLVSFHCSERIAERWKIKVNSHPAAGHDLTLDAPLWVTEQIKDWHKNRL